MHTALAQPTWKVGTPDIEHNTCTIISKFNSLKVYGISDSLLLGVAH